MIGILAAGQVTNLPSQHFLLAYLTHRIKLCIGIYKTIPRARGNYELHFLTEKDGFVNRFLQVSAARFLVFGEKSSTFALVNETMNLVNEIMNPVNETMNLVNETERILSLTITEYEVTRLN